MPVGSGPTFVVFYFRDLQYRRESTMGTEMIIRDERRNFHHLSDVRIAEIVTKVDCLRKSGMPRTAGMKRIAEETGCALDTV